MYALRACVSRSASSSSSSAFICIHSNVFNVVVVNVVNVVRSSDAMRRSGLAESSPADRQRPPPAPNMASLEDLYAVSRRLCFDMQEGLGKLEREDDGRRARNENLARDMRTRMGELTKVTSELERQFRVQAMKQSMAKSDVWKVRDFLCEACVRCGRCASNKRAGSCCAWSQPRARAAFLVPPKRVRVDLFMDGGMRH